MKRSAPSATRNREPILEVLHQVLPDRGLVLEIASGTGEHAVHFAAALPGLTWQPTDPDADARASIAAWRDEAGLPNLRPPLPLDVTAAWPVDAADAMLCINMIHISPWDATRGLMHQAGRLLPHGAPLLLYGPYKRPDRPIEPSNAAFDADLQARDPRWGLRDLADVEAEAAANALRLTRIVEMPANNLTLVFRKD